MTTTITITGSRRSTHGSAPIWQRFDIVADDGREWLNSTRRWATVTLVTELGVVDSHHAANLLDEALVSPVSTEV